MSSTEGCGETPSVVASLPGAPEQTYLFPKAKGHSRSISHGGQPMLAGAPPRPLKSALRGHQRALSHGQIGQQGGPGGGHTRANSRTDFILPPGHREGTGGGGGVGASGRAHHSRQASRSDSIYTLRRESSAGPWRRTLLWLLRRRALAADNRHLLVVPNHLVPDKTPPEEHPNGERCGNRVRTTKYTLLSFLPKNLFEQFHRVANVYFICIVLLNWVPALNAFGKEVAMLPVLFVLTVTALKDLFEDRRRHYSDKRINNLQCRVFKRSVEKYVSVKWSEVRVGDIIHLSNNESVPADMVLLHCSSANGVCYLDTCNLDGETNLKQRLVAPGFRQMHAEFQPLKFKSTVEVERPSTKIYRFNGCIAHPEGERVPLASEHLLLRDCTLKNTDYVEGIVVYAGHETKAMLNNGGPRYKCSKLERHMNKDVVWSVLVLLFLCCTGAVGCKLWLDYYYDRSVGTYHNVPFLADLPSPGNEGLLKFWTFIIVLQVMIPVSLYVTIEVTKLFQVYYIHQDVQLYDAQTDSRAECRALNITEELGQISYLFTDKTGTLTENKMVFRRCCVGGVDYPHPSAPPGTPPALRAPLPLHALPPLVTPVTDVAPCRRMLQHLHDPNDGKHTQNVKEFLLILAICNTVVVSLPHVDRMALTNERADKANGAPEQHTQDKYVRLAESRSTTPSPPPTGTQSPRRLRLSPLPALPRLLPNLDEETKSTSKANVAVARFEAESPDELALAEAALAYGYELRARNPDDVTLGVLGALTTRKVLRVLDFDANRKCMSIAIQGEDEQEVVLYVKGADSTVLGALAPMRAGSAEAAAYERTRALLAEYARGGLRTLAMAKRVMSRTQWEQWQRDHATAMGAFEDRERRMRESLARLESGLTLVGATGVEDRLQDAVPATVRALLAAGIIVWVLTGDKPETAVNIAYSAALFSQSDRLLYLMSKDKDHAESTIKTYLESGLEGHSGRALVVDGRTLTYILDRRSGLVAPFLSLARRCSSVLCCRATPLQKAYIVKAVKEELGVTTLAVGDGANDVSMIQTADVGVGLSGQEGRQAMMAADFTLARFKHLQRLLLVHGHWSYDRIAKMVLFFFLKNATFVFMVFWSQLYCGFSTTVMIDQMHWMLYNLVFTSCPPVVMGVWDRVAPASLLMGRPALYACCRRGTTYQPHSFWINLLESAYIGAVIFFTVCTAYWDSTVDLMVFGMCNMTCCLVCMLCYVAVETRSWTCLHVMALLGSLLAYALMSLVFHSVCITCFVPSTYHVVFHAFGDPRHWLLTILTAAAGLTPRLALSALRNSLRPRSLSRAVMARRRRRRTRELPYAAHYTTAEAEAHVYRSTSEEGFAKSPPIPDVPEVT